MDLRKFVIPEFVLGKDALRLAGQYANNFGAKKVLLVSDHGVIDSGWTKKVQLSLDKAGLRYRLFSDLSSNPKDTEVMAGAEEYNRISSDLIIAVGGGSVIDCAKGIGIIVNNKGHIRQFDGVDKITIPSPPLICIPTTAGSSADISQFAIITDTSRKIKFAIISKAIVPDIALIDPVTTTTMSADQTAFTGMDALVHAIESFVSNANSSITDLNALEAIRLIKTNLPDAIRYPLDMNYRDLMMSSSLFAGIAFSNASLGLVHSMSHSLGGYYDLPQGECNSILLEYVVDFNFDYASERYFRIAEALGLDLIGLSFAQKKTMIIENLIKFRKDVGITNSLSDLGVQKKDIPILAKNAYNDAFIVTNPREPTVQDIENIYEKAL